MREILTSRHMEIERKYLVDKLPEGLLDNYEGEEILQGYVKVSPYEIRLRKKGNKFWLTKKNGGGLQREEVEIEISREIFDILWPLTEDKRIEKVRYKIPLGNLEIELDIYNNRRMVAEVELPDKDYRFESPKWFGKEVTYDERYKNKNLAINGFSKEV